MLSPDVKGGKKKHTRIQFEGTDESGWLGVNRRPPNLEARVGDEPGVVAQVGGVVLHHAFGLRLAEVLVGGGEAAG